jgi:hypothetical protein
MADSREDRIYDLQQALLGMPPDRWEQALQTHCAGDASLRAELMRRLQTPDWDLRRGPRFLIRPRGKPDTLS